jgi:tetratricopeptide (TPR) repeat protein
MKTMAAWLFCLAIAACSAACSSLPQEPAAPPPELFNDSGFAPASEPVGAEGLFDLSPAMRGYLNSPAFRTQLRNKGLARGLVDALYQKGELKIEYDASMTRNAAQAFDARSGNCMSLVIMTAAFAKELGLEVYYQNVVAVESWRRSGSLYLASSHVNLSLDKPKSLGLRAIEAAEQPLTIDFLPPADMAGYRKIQLEENAIVAMYLNNRAVETLVLDKVDDAYWWARAAVAKNPAFVAAYNTLGVIYRRHGDTLLAERSFRLALEREPDNLIVMQNLAPLLATLGKNEESQALARRVAAIEPNPPFHFFALGIKALERQDYKEAKAQFAREVARAPDNDEFHFWLGVAMLRLGESAQAKEQIALALESATTRDGRERYSAKLALLRANAAQRARPD